MALVHTGTAHVGLHSWCLPVRVLHVFRALARSQGHMFDVRLLPPPPPYRSLSHPRVPSLAVYLPVAAPVAGRCAPWPGCLPAWCLGFWGWGDDVRIAACALAPARRDAGRGRADGNGQSAGCRQSGHGLQFIYEPVIYFSKHGVPMLCPCPWHGQ